MQIQSERPATQRKAGIVVAAIAIVLSITLGVVLRLSDPLSSSVIPAEDPYTHMALVREPLRTGTIHSLNDNQNIYPPGLHGFLAAAWTYTGTDLYDLMRFGAVVLGGIGILGMAVLLWRTAGPVAAFVGALALAVAPEAIFRSTMMSPTALDLAILPFFFYALLRTLAGRIGWAGVAAPMAVFLAIAHPWILAILCAAGVVFLVLAALMPWPTTRAAPLSLMGAASCIAVLGTGLAIALMMPGFGQTLKLPGPESPIALALGIAAISALPVIGLSLLRRRGTGKMDAWNGFRQRPLLMRVTLSLVIAATLSFTYMGALTGGLPMHVEMRKMFGWPILGLAFATLVALPFIARPVAILAAALLAVTIPFTWFNPLHSEFLSHRTAIFFGLGLFMLAGVGAGALVGAVAAALRTMDARKSALDARTSATAARKSQASPAAASSTNPIATASSTISARPRPRPILYTAMPALLVALLLGGSVYAGTPDAYDGGWYRLYTECELDALREVAARADQDPSAIVITGSWQSKLVLAALTTDASRIWFKGDFYTSEEVRGDLVATMENQGRPIIVIADRHLRIETPDADMGFASSPPWQSMGSFCANMGVEQPRLTAFSTDEAAQ